APPRLGRQAVGGLEERRTRCLPPLFPSSSLPLLLSSLCPRRLPRRPEQPGGRGAERGLDGVVELGVFERTHVVEEREERLAVREAHARKVGTREVGAREVGPAQVGPVEAGA